MTTLGLYFTQEQAQAAFDELAQHCFDVVLSFGYTENHMPQEHYAVIVQPRLTSMPAERLLLLIEIAGRHDCTVHLMPGEGLRLFRVDRTRP